MMTLTWRDSETRTKSLNVGMTGVLGTVDKDEGDIESELPEISH